MPEDTDLRSFFLVEDSRTTQGTISHFPLTIGRLTGNDVVLAHPAVSRVHAQIVMEKDGIYLVDRGSRHGTFVNGEMLQAPRRLRPTDSIHFGTMRGPAMIFRSPDTDYGTPIRQLLEDMPADQTSAKDLEKLRWFVESARKLNSTGSLDQVLVALLEATLQLTRAERAYVFLRDGKGEMKLALGRSRDGEPLVDESTISHSALAKATSTSKNYIVTDTLNAVQQAVSIVAHNIRLVICIPLRRLRGNAPGRERELLGVLYLDSRRSGGNLSEIDNDLLNTIATDASALIDNAQLTVAEESERHYREELGIAAGIQRSLMAIKLPSLDYASVSARYLPCREVGGDFFDVFVGADFMSVVVADVSGKGISAALLASTLQGMIYAQLAAGQALSDIAASVNRYLKDKEIDKYATMSLLRLGASGYLEYINCGHIPPILWHDGRLTRLSENNMPVGLDDRATFVSASVQLEPGTRIVLVTDGITEARDEHGEFFEDGRVDSAVMRNAGIDCILDAVELFAGSRAAEDDRTIVEVLYAREGK